MSVHFMPRCLLALLCVVPLAGCAISSIAFAPVDGPYAAAHRGPAFEAQVAGAIFPDPGTGPGGQLIVPLANGELYKGSWQAVAPAAAASPAAASDLAAEWDLVYGPGYYKAHVLPSMRRAQALLTSSAGATAVAEVYKNHGECGEARGVARDSLGNVYKVNVHTFCAAPVAYQEGGPSGPNDGSHDGTGGVPQVVIPATGGPPVIAVPVGAGVYQPVTGGPPVPAIPTTPPN